MMANAGLPAAYFGKQLKWFDASQRAGLHSGEERCLHISHEIHSLCPLNRFVILQTVSEDCDTLTEKKPELRSMQTILVVDDDLTILSVLECFLQQHEYQTLLACDGAEALELLRRQPVDLILADVAMPGLSGYQLCEQVKGASDPALALIPVILFSARNLASDIRFGKALGADDYLTKPLDLDTLLAVVRGKLCAAERLRDMFTTRETPEPVINLTLGRRQLRLEPEGGQVWLDDRTLPLTDKEMRLLACLARRPGWVVSDVDLVEATHGLKQAGKQEARGKAVRSIVAYLRRKLAGAVCIETVRGRGYMLVVS